MEMINLIAPKTSLLSGYYWQTLLTDRLAIEAKNEYNKQTENI